jgi:hypothetical protein
MAKGASMSSRQHPVGARWARRAAHSRAAPPEDAADYSITVSWPGHDGTETVTFKSVCTTDDRAAECEDAARVRTGHEGV